jgi:glutamate-5-semialdehyde dehydrogenase
MNINKQMEKTKNTSYKLALLTDDQRNMVLFSIANKLRNSYDKILTENARDLSQMKQSNPMYDRLLLTKERLESIANDIESITSIPSPVAKKLAHQVMQNGLIIEKISVPLGVVAVIYESRPNVTLDVFSLCFKTGNACILKGGKEAYYSNLILVQIIQSVLLEQNVDIDAVYLMPPNREDIKILLNATDIVDVCIPRGSQALIDFVRDNAKIPVIETGAGIVHNYFDLSGDTTKGRNIINNAKTRRVSVCNALDCLIIHKTRLDDLYALVELLQHHNVEILADQNSYKFLENLYPNKLLSHANNDDFGHEFLSYKLAIKTVESMDEAIEHITTHSSRHSEAIITEDKVAAEYFVERVDAAAVYINASTAFTDGGQFGMGAEIGISTQKLHARGPMGLEALTSYKWIIHGDGQTRA